MEIKNYQLPAGESIELIAIVPTFLRYPGQDYPDIYYPGEMIPIRNNGDGKFELFLRDISPLVCDVLGHQ